MTDLIPPVGPRLKAERERRGLSAQKVADELRLDGWIIDALETEDYERVGPSVFAKGHLKRYAAFLGLPTAEIMAGYETRVHAPEPPAAQPANVRLRTDDAPAVSNLPLPQIVGSVAAVLLILGVLWWKPWHQRGTAAVQSQPPAATPSASDADSAANSVGADAASAPASRTSPASAPSLPSTPPAAAAANPAPAGAPEQNAAGVGHARLRLSFSADSWVDVHDAAGRRAFAGNGRANSVRTVAGIAPMRVYLGYASGVQLEINNRAVAIGPQFVSGDVARFEAGADGVLRRDSHAAAAPAAAAPGAAPPPGIAPQGANAPSVQSRDARPNG
jgi:cytoskeleton protein RodZ